MDPRNPRAEATARLPSGYVARVLEPSPPAVDDGEWFADDPTDPSGASGVVVSPVSDADLSWDEFVRDRAHLARFAADHWLGAWHRVGPLPAGFRSTRDALHRVAFFVLAPARHAATGRLGLRYTHRGFGTPFFGDDEQIRVEGGDLIRQTRDRVHVAPITTVADAADFAGIEYRDRWFDRFEDPLMPADPHERLSIDAEASDAVGAWFGFATSVLEELRRAASRDADVGRVQLWPEHFDVAVEIGPPGRRAAYGASPGDRGHPDPYVYVVPGEGVDHGDPYWNAEGFRGSQLSYPTLLEARDQRSTALDFLTEGLALVTGR